MMQFGIARFGFEQRWRDGLLAALLPTPKGENAMPAWSDLDLGPFWAHFHETAPAHLLIGFRAATWVLAGALPRLLGYGSALDGLEADQREAVVTRGASLPLVCELVEVAKIVACLAYFDADAVQAAVRGEATAWTA